MLCRADGRLDRPGDHGPVPGRLPIQSPCEKTGAPGLESVVDTQAGRSISSGSRLAASTSAEASANGSRVRAGHLSAVRRARDVRPELAQVSVVIAAGSTIVSDGITAGNVFTHGCTRRRMYPWEIKTARGASIMFGHVGLQVMYGAAVLGAGLVGALTLLAPGLAGRHILAAKRWSTPTFAFSARCGWRWGWWRCWVSPARRRSCRSF